MKMEYYYLQHIPKTAGTSIRHFMKKHGQRHGFKFIWSNDWGRPHDTFRTKDEIAKLAKVPANKITTFTFLRSPYEHSRSLYSWIRKYKPHPYHQEVLRTPFTKWLETYGPLSNYFCGFLGGKTSEEAAENLRQFDYVGMTENVDYLMNIMLKKYRLDFSNSRRYYATEPFKITKHQKQLIERRRREDFKLLRII